MSLSDTSPAPEARGATRDGGSPEGNPYSRRVARLRWVLLECVTEDVRRLIVATLTQKAIAGDISAAKLLLQYTVGKPAPAAHPDRLDADELSAFRDNACPADLKQTMLAVPAYGLLPIVRATAEGVAESAQRQAEETIRDKIVIPDARKAARQAQAQATVTKRSVSAQSMPADDPADAAQQPATADLLSVLDLAGIQQACERSRAANQRREQE